ncbi:MAG: hypothetical protein Tsb002_27620 [Wenzhouxiangellaceae bacterium]
MTEKLPTKEEMQTLIDMQISSMGPGLKQYAESLIIPLKAKVLKWEYGNDEDFPAWEFADLGERNVRVAYCLGGHGANGDSWGLVFADDDYFGMDCGWYGSFKDLLLDGWYEQDI